MERRDFMRTMCAGGVATFGFPTVLFASVRQPGRLVFVLLRGGFDGLAAIVPYGDPEYRALRGALAFDTSEIVALNDTFGLAPGLASLKSFWDAGELVVLHALAIPYRTRSHFDGQAVLETGLDRPIGSSDGWLNRLLQVMHGERSGMAIASGMPRSLDGSFPVQTCSPTQLDMVTDDYLERLTALHRRGAVLQGRFEAALQQKDVVGEEPMAGGGRGRRPGITQLFQAAARILRQNTGPNVAAVEVSGWDTHANQGGTGGALDRLLAQLSDALVRFRREMGEAWPSTTVVVMTEFGRTARPNRTRGTDHGTGGAGFVIGPRVARSTVLADWPGLGNRALYEGRDLAPTTDTRAVLKGAIGATFDLTVEQADRVFPDSSGVRGLHTMMR